MHPGRIKECTQGIREYAGPPGGREVPQDARREWRICSSLSAWLGIPDPPPARLPVGPPKLVRGTNLTGVLFAWYTFYGPSIFVVLIVQSIKIPGANVLVSLPGARPPGAAKAKARRAARYSAGHALEMDRSFYVRGTNFMGDLFLWC